MIENSATGSKLIGFFRGEVVQHLAHGYCKIYIPSVYPLEWKQNIQFLPPAELASSLFAGTNTGNGVFTYPNIGSIVWCFFANNDQNYPVYFASSLGGENAFGQYELIKYPSEEISERHLITSKKSHVEWYESGKLSLLVEDPDRRDASVDYSNNTYIGMISDDAVSGRNTYEKIAAEELSNIYCRVVLDNDNLTQGAIINQTYHYDLINTATDNMTLTNNNYIVVDNAGNVNCTLMSAYDRTLNNAILTNITANIDTFKSIDGNVNHQIHHQLHTLDELQTDIKIDASITKHNNLIPGNVDVDQLCTYTYISKDRIENLTADVQSKRNIAGSNDYNIHYQQSILDINNKTTTQIDSSSTQSHSILNGNVKCELTSSYVFASQKGGISLKADVESDFTVEGNMKHNVHYVKNVVTLSGNAIMTDCTLDKCQDRQSGFKSNMNYIFTDKDAKTAINNVLTYDNEANSNNNASSKLHINSNIVQGGSPTVLVDIIDNIDATAATIERKIDNKLKTITAYDKTDATNSVHEIKITDAQTLNNSFINIDTKSGSLTIDMTGSSGKCTIVLKSSGDMTIDTTNSLKITSPNITIDAKSTLDINGGTITIDPDAIIGGVSYNGHVHPYTDSGGWIGNGITQTRI